MSHLHGHYHEMRKNDQNPAKVLWQKGAKIRSTHGEKDQNAILAEFRT